LSSRLSFDAAAGQLRRDAEAAPILTKDTDWMRYARLTAAAALLAAPALAAAQAPAPAPPALVDRFMSVLPDAGKLKEVGRPDPEMLRSLKALNPGKESRVEAILVAQEACLSPVANRTSERLMREIAAQFGEAKLQKLISFYDGPDLARLDALAANSESARTAADLGEMQTILERYGLMELHVAMSNLPAKFIDDAAFMKALESCASAREQAFAREQLVEQADAPLPAPPRPQP
jgi:hypothetical protein